jgi:hypothetical protein
MILGGIQGSAKVALRTRCEQESRLAPSHCLLKNKWRGAKCQANQVFYIARNLQKLYRAFFDVSSHFSHNSSL